MEQITALSINHEDLFQRDVLIFLWGGGCEPSEWQTDVKISSATVFGRRFPDLKQSSWCLKLIGRDGRVKAVWDRVVATNELFARIDAMPMGRLEKEERRKKRR